MSKWEYKESDGLTRTGSHPLGYPKLTAKDYKESLKAFRAFVGGDIDGDYAIYDGIWEKHNKKDFFVITKYMYLGDFDTEIEKDLKTARSKIDSYFKRKPRDKELVIVCTGVSCINDFFNKHPVDVVTFITEGDRRYQGATGKAPEKNIGPKPGNNFVALKKVNGRYDLPLADFMKCKQVITVEEKTGYFNHEPYTTVTARTYFINPKGVTVVIKNYKNRLYGGGSEEKMSFDDAWRQIITKFVNQSYVESSKLKVYLQPIDGEKLAAVTEPLKQKWKSNIPMKNGEYVISKAEFFKAKMIIVKSYLWRTKDLWHIATYTISPKDVLWEQKQYHKSPDNGKEVYDGSLHETLSKEEAWMRFSDYAFDADRIKKLGVTIEVIAGETPKAAPKKAPAKSEPKGYKIVEPKSPSDFRTKPITKEDVEGAKIIIMSSGGEDSYITEYKIEKIIDDFCYYVRTSYKQKFEYVGDGVMKAYPRRNVEVSRKKTGIYTFVDTINHSISLHDKEQWGGVYTTVEIIYDETPKQEPPKQEPEKKKQKEVLTIESEDGTKRTLFDRWTVFFGGISMISDDREKLYPTIKEIKAIISPTTKKGDHTWKAICWRRESETEGRILTWFVESHYAELKELVNIHVFDEMFDSLTKDKKIMSVQNTHGYRDLIDTLREVKPSDTEWWGVITVDKGPKQEPKAEPPKSEIEMFKEGYRYPTGFDKRDPKTGEWIREHDILITHRSKMMVTYQYVPTGKVFTSKVSVKNGVEIIKAFGGVIINAKHGIKSVDVPKAVKAPKRRKLPEPKPTIADKIRNLLNKSEIITYGKYHTIVCRKRYDRKERKVVGGWMIEEVSDEVNGGRGVLEYLVNFMGQNKTGLSGYVHVTKEVSWAVSGYRVTTKYVGSVPYKSEEWGSLPPDSKTKAEKEARRKARLSKVKTVRKLMAEGKGPKPGHVTRLGIERQTGKANQTKAGKKADEPRKAMLPGYRVSASGKLYRETRANRSDTPKERRDATYIRRMRRQVKGTGRANLPDKYKPSAFIKVVPLPHSMYAPLNQNDLRYLPNSKIKKTKVLTVKQQWAVCKKIMRKYKDDPIEHLFVVDKYGNCLFIAKGNEVSVSTMPPHNWYIDHAGDRLFECHNHPGWCATNEGANWYGHTITYSESDLMAVAHHECAGMAVFGEDNLVFELEWVNDDKHRPFWELSLLKAAYRWVRTEAEELSMDAPDVKEYHKSCLAAWSDATQAERDNMNKEYTKRIKIRMAEYQPIKWAELCSKKVFDYCGQTYHIDGRLKFTKESLS